MLREERGGHAQPRLALPGGKRTASDVGRADTTAAREMREELGEALAVSVLQGSAPAGAGVWEQHTRAVVHTLQVTAQASAAVRAQIAQWVPQGAQPGSSTRIVGVEWVSVSRLRDATWVHAHLHAHSALQIRVAMGPMHIPPPAAQQRPSAPQPPPLQSPLPQRPHMSCQPAAARPLATPQCPQLGEQRTQPPRPPRPPGQLWDLALRNDDPEQYAALHSQEVRADPVLRLAVRDPAVEDGAGVTLASGVRVCMDERERTVMREVRRGITTARRATGEALEVAADLHARHHFTCAAAVDGSLKEEELPGGGLRRELAYGVWEGAQGTGWGSQATAAGLSGASLAPDGEIADAELAAIHAYLRRVVERSPEPARERVLVMSDSLGCLDSLEAAWRAGDARGLRTRDRGALLESCCVLRAKLQLVVFMYVSAHSGNAMNAMADAAAKAHVHSPVDDMHDVPTRVTSRPVVYRIASDFDNGGRLKPPNLDSNGRLQLPRASHDGNVVIWDRRLFPGVRVRVARWVHRRLVRDLHGSYVDEALIGRRWHTSDARTYAAVAKEVYTCATLKGGKDREADPVGRMADDTQRVHIATVARGRDIAGVRGAQDARVQAAARAERAAQRPGAACRQMAHGCAGCSRHPFDEDGSSVCGLCHGWRLRARRDDGTCRACGARSVCAGCGGRVACVACAQSGRAAVVAGAKRADGGTVWATGTRTRRRLGPTQDGSSRWVGFAGLAQTTVERLLRLGDETTADARASNLPPATTQADARHILGGECPGVSCAEENAAEASASVRGMQRCVAAAGGRASTLFMQLEAAGAYIAAPAAARAAQPEARWRAYLRVVAGDLERPDWPMGGGDARTAAAERDELAATLATHIVEGAGVSCARVQRGWRDETRSVVSRRERREAGRGLMRVCMRAWREVADGVLAGAAAFEQRWRREEDCALAQRLVISDKAQHTWNGVEWLAARRVLTWMRLVRAGAVHRARSQSPAWRAARAAWRERRYYHALPHATGPDLRHERLAVRTAQRTAVAERGGRNRGETQARAGAAHVPSEAVEATPASDEEDAQRERDEASGSADERDDEIDGVHSAEGGAVPRTRRTDYVLALTGLAAESFGRQLSGGHTRLVHARRKRGDG